MGFTHNSEDSSEFAFLLVENYTHDHSILVFGSFGNFCIKTFSSRDFYIFHCGQLREGCREEEEEERRDGNSFTWKYEAMFVSNVEVRQFYYFLQLPCEKRRVSYVKLCQHHIPLSTLTPTFNLHQHHHHHQHVKNSPHHRRNRSPRPSSHQSLHTRRLDLHRHRPDPRLSSLNHKT